MSAVTIRLTDVSSVVTSTVAPNDRAAATSVRRNRSMPRSSPVQVLRRDVWTGKASQLGDLLLMRKAGSHRDVRSLDARIRMGVPAVRRRVLLQVCHSQDEVFTFVRPGGRPDVERLDVKG